MNSRLLLIVGLSFVGLLLLALGAGLLAARRSGGSVFEVFAVGWEHETVNNR